MKKLLITIFLLFAIFPAQAQEGTKFTVYGQVFNTDGTPINGVTVYLFVSGSTINTTTTTGERTDSSLVNGYYLLDLANLQVAVGEGTSMTLSASYGAASASKTVARAAAEPQRIDLYLSTGVVSGGGDGGGGGGGGGGAPSAEPYENIIKRESREEFVVKDLPVKYIFTTPELPVSEIMITSTFNAGMITAQAELLKSTSKLVKENASGTVYKYINLWVGTSGFAVPKNIKEAIIKFKVENSWLASGGFKDTDIVMERWDGAQWLSLDTQPKNKDESFTYFEAKTNAFSSFAITGLKGRAVPTATPAVEVTVTPAKPTGTPTPSPVPTKKISGFEIVLVMVVFSAVYIFVRKRR